MLLSAVFALAAAQAPAVADDFNDGVIAPFWTPIFNPLQFWNVSEANGFWNYDGVTTPFGAFQERFILEAALSQPLTGAFALDFRLLWEEIAALPPGSGVTLTHVVLLDSGQVEIARFGYEDLNTGGGGELVFQSGASRVTVAQAAAGDAAITVLRDGSGMLHYAINGSGGASSGPVGAGAGGVAFLRIQVEHNSLCGPCGPFLEPTRFDWIEFEEAGGPVLAVAGSCPGVATMSVTGATPGGTVIVLYGAAGSATKPGGTCAGTSVAISQPRVAFSLSADAGGAAGRALNLPPSACGRTVQAVDVASCAASNAVLL